MLLTVTNLSATDSIEVGFPFNITLGPSGSKELGVSAEDLMKGEDQGDSAYKRLNLMRQKGQISMSVADDPENSSILDEMVTL